MQAHQIELLLDGVRFIHDISEIQITKILLYLFRESTFEHLKGHIQITLQNAELTEETRKWVMEGDNLLDFYVDQIVRLPTTEMPLRKALSLLQSPHVAYMMAYMRRRLLLAPKDAPITQTRAAIKWKSPSTASVVHWTSALIDSHVSNILLSNDLEHLLLDLFVVLREELVACEQMQGVSGQLWQFFHRKESQARAIPEYSVEVLALGK